MNSPSFYWYDYETFGIDPRVDRISQFAGIRTDMDFNIIDEPVDILCKAADDILPNPDASLITGITPQDTLKTGLLETDFIEKILQEFSRPNTCVTGFNNIRFDDEFTRYTLYRNFFDPYSREWQNACSRWDIIDLVRITRALRPEGINWPVDDKGIASNRLELITKENGISHEAAHDALSDVHATIAVAKLIKDKQPRLFNFVFEHKNKQKLSQLLNLHSPQPVLHTSGMYSSEICNSAMIYPLAQHPTNKNGIVAYDLRYSPEDLIKLSADEIIERLYTPRDQLAEGVARIPLKTIHINKCPVIAPLSTLDEASAKRTQIDRTLHLDHLEKLKSVLETIKPKLQKIYNHKPFPNETDPDKSLYSGGFFSADDKQRMQQLHEMNAEDLAKAQFNFEDQRLDEMLFRYRARNFPATLSAEEKSRWNEYRLHRFTDDSKSTLSYTSFKEIINEHLNNNELSADKKAVLLNLQQWGGDITKELQL